MPIVDRRAVQNLLQETSEQQVHGELLRQTKIDLKEAPRRQCAHMMNRLAIVMSKSRQTVLIRFTCLWVALTSSTPPQTLNDKIHIVKSGVSFATLNQEVCQEHTKNITKETSDHQDIRP
jgi:hypothetical protein